MPCPEELLRIQQFGRNFPKCVCSGEIFPAIYYVNYKHEWYWHAKKLEGCAIRSYINKWMWNANDGHQMISNTTIFKRLIFPTNSVFSCSNAHVDKFSVVINYKIKFAINHWANTYIEPKICPFVSQHKSIILIHPCSSVIV